MVDRHYSEAELYYVAGVLDSEGYLGISRCRRRSSFYYNARVAVGQTNQSWLQNLKQVWGGAVYPGRGKRDKHERWASIWQWVVTGDDMIALLVAVKPLLRRKKEQAEILLEFQVAAQKADVEKKHKLYDRCRLLNRKGPRSKQLGLTIESGKPQYMMGLGL